MHFETADLKGIVRHTKELILPKGVIERKQRRTVFYQRIFMYISISNLPKLN